MRSSSSHLPGLLKNQAFSCQDSCAQARKKALVSDDTVLDGFGVLRINRDWKTGVEAGPGPGSFRRLATGTP